MNERITVGDVIRFEYPRYNSIGCPKDNWRAWTICVTKVRDTRLRSLHPETIRRRPLTGRGRILITGYCLARHVERSFYVDSMRHRLKDNWLTLQLVDPVDPESSAVASFGVFAPTVQDRNFMAIVIDYFYQVPETYHALIVSPMEAS